VRSLDLEKRFFNFWVRQGTSLCGMPTAPNGCAERKRILSHDRVWWRILTPSDSTQDENPGKGQFTGAGRWPLAMGVLIRHLLQQSGGQELLGPLYWSQSKWNVFSPPLKQTVPLCYKETPKCTDQRPGYSQIETLTEKEHSGQRAEMSFDW
jgi:hypothetical protein